MRPLPLVGCFPLKSVSCSVCEGRPIAVAAEPAMYRQRRYISIPCGAWYIGVFVDQTTKNVLLKFHATARRSRSPSVAERRNGSRSLPCATRLIECTIAAMQHNIERPQ